MNKPFVFAFTSAAALQAIPTTSLLVGMGCYGIIDGAAVLVQTVEGSASGTGYYLPNDNAISGLTWQVVGG